MQQVHGGKERVLTRGGLTDTDRKKKEKWSKACREKSAEPIVAKEMIKRRGEVNNR